MWFIIHYRAALNGIGALMGQHLVAPPFTSFRWLVWSAIAKPARPHTLNANKAPGAIIGGAIGASDDRLAPPMIAPGAFFAFLA